MKKVIFETIGNIIMFILLGLTLTKGIAIKGANNLVTIEANGFVQICLLFMVVYVILLAIINKKQKGSFKRLFTGLQLYKDTDERDKHITGEAAKTTYLATIVVLTCAMTVPIVLRIYEFLFQWDVNYYAVSTWSPIIAMIVLNIIFSIRWCKEYRK